MIKYRRFFLILILGILLSRKGVISSQPLLSSFEYEIKAAFLYNFAKFTEWPPETFSGENDSLIIGVLGQDPFGNVLEKLIGGKTIGGRPITIHRFRYSMPFEQSHILFISESETPRLSDIFQRLQKACVLTVSDIPEFAQKGGMIHLYPQENKIRFAINLSQVEKARLKLSAKLLNLAKIVTEKGQ